MTICEKCGTEREYIDDACPACQFHPKSVRELATATLLTSKFDAGEESFGTEPELLDALAREIRAGRHPVLDEDELLRHERTVEAFLQARPSDVFWALFRSFLPGLLILGAMLAGVVLLRIIRNWN